MARINIETDIWADSDFQDLMIKVGNRHAAKGILIELWVLAQKYWFPEKKLIPLAEVERAGLMPAVEVGLGELREGGVYAKGSKEAFAWLFEKQEAGKKSAKVRKEKYGTSQPGKSKKPRKKKEPPNTTRTVIEQPSNTPEQDRTPPNSSEPLTLTPSLTPSLFSSSTSDSEFYSVGGTPPSATQPPQGIRSPIGLFIATYVEAYKARYGENARPDLRGKVQGEIRRYVNETPIERACEMIRTYCEMDDGWFITKGHAFTTFVENLSKVGIRLDTGTHITRKQAQAAETSNYHRDQLRRIAEGKL